MPLKADLETAAVTLPLDTLLETIKAARGKGELSPETLSLLQIEVSYVVSQVGGLEEEVLKGILRDNLGIEAREP